MALTNTFLNQTATNNIYWVDSEQQGRSMPVAFGASVSMLDRNVDFMYIKSVDQSGVMTAFRKFRLEEIIDMPPGDFVSREDYDNLKNEFENLKAMVENQQNKPSNNNNYKNNYKNNRRDYNN